MMINFSHMRALGALTFAAAMMGCGAPAVSATTPWSDSRAVSFRYGQSQLGITMPPAGTCLPSVSFSYTHVTRTLTRDTCVGGVAGTRDVVLDVSQQERVFDQLNALRVVTPARACSGNDGTVQSFGVRYTDGTSRSFTESPPSCSVSGADEQIETSDLSALGAALQSIISG